MTRLLTTGYETGDVNEAGTANVSAAGALSAVSSSPTPRAGNYCLKAASLGTTWTPPTSRVFALPAAKTEIWLRFAFLSHFTLSTACPVAMLQDSAAGNQISLTYTTSDGLLRLYRGQATTLLGTASAAFAQDTWHVIDWRVQILTGTTGASEVWLDGTQVINFSGDTSQTATLNVQTLQLGQLNASGISPASGSYLAYDDIAVNDTAGSVNNGRVGDSRVVLLVPTGAGSSTVLTRGGTDTGANWSQTNELPPSLSQYVLSATAADRDLYAMADLGVSVTSINVVEELVLAQNSDAGAGSLGLTIKSGATTNEATAQSLGTSAAYVVARWETDPNTSAAWTASGVNALEAGVTVR